MKTIALRSLFLLGILLVPFGLFFYRRQLAQRMAALGRLLMLTL